MKFTVFTPVYNKKNTINRVWTSLQNQTFRDFEWIIVDDGSSDDVGPLLESYKSRSDFPVTILTQANSGKHIAWNRAIALAKGELFVPADSDDEFASESLEHFNNYWNQIDENLKPSFSGVNVLCTTQKKTNQVHGDKYPDQSMVSNNLELAYKYKITGEKWGCIRTDLLKQRPFPEVIGNFYPESYLWFYLARNYKVLCVNDILRIYYLEEEGNLSHDLIRSKKNLVPMLHYTLWELDNNLDYISKYQGWSEVIKKYIKVWSHTFNTNFPAKTVFEKKSFISKLLLSITYPLGFIHALATKSKYR